MLRSVVALAAIAILGGIASANPIVYTLTTTATGKLGASTFTDATVTVTLTADTSNIAFGPSPLNFALINPGSATVSISGLGTSTLTDSIEILSSFDTLISGNSGVIIAQLDNPAGTSVSGIVAEYGTAFFGYGLQDPLGPISGTGGAASGPANIFPTTAGNLQFTIQPPSSGPSTFTVTGGVPEPTSMILLGTGLLGLIGVHFCRTRA